MSERMDGFDADEALKRARDDCRLEGVTGWQQDPVLEWLEGLQAEDVVIWASPEALVARRRQELRAGSCSDADAVPS